MTPSLTDQRPLAAHRFAAALRRPRAEEEPQRVAALLEEVDDWPGVLAVARDQQSLELLALLADRSGAGLPVDAAVALRDARKTARRAALVVGETTARLVAALTAAGVETAVFKGQAVALQAYGDAAARRSVDVDLLVDRADRERASAAIIAAGYRLQPQLSPRLARVILRGECETTLAQPAAVTVELHWQVVPSSYGTPLPARALLQHARPLDVLGWQIPSLRLEDAVVVAAVHGYKHFWQMFEHAICLAALLCSPALDADRLLRRARALGAWRRTLVGAAVAASVTDAPLPAALTSGCARDGSARKVAGQALDQLWATVEGRIPVRRIGRSTSLDVSALDRPGDLARCLAAKVALPRMEDYEWMRLPDAAAPMYHAVRPARLAWQAMSGFSRRARSRRTT